jgi:hypothetical protein
MLFIYEDKLVKQIKEKMAAYYENHRTPPQKKIHSKRRVLISKYIIEVPIESECSEALPS